MKKTLVISAYAPPSGSGSGLMMYFLLKYFPSGKLAILTSENNTSAQISQYRLNVPYYYYGNKILAVNFSEHAETFAQKLKRSIKNFWLTKFLAQIPLLIFIPIKIVQTGRRAITEQNIEILLGYSDWGLVLFGVYLLHKITKKPFVLHFYDMYAGNKMPLLFGLLAKWLEPRLFKEAKNISVMCEELQAYYQKKYSREIQVVHNAIDFPETMPNLPPLNPTEFKITFLGNVYWAQEQALRNIAQAVQSLSELRVKLYLYTPHSKEYLNSIGLYESEKIVFTFCQPQDVANVMATSNLLVVPLSFNTEYPELINTSSPGKLCEYLVSGRPILVHAPAKSFLSKYAKENNFALVVDIDDKSQVAEKIRQAYVSTDQPDQLTLNAFKIANINHRAKTEAQKLTKLLI